MSAPKGKGGKWNVEPDNATPNMKHAGQGTRMAGVGQDPVPTKAAYKDGYETNYKGLPGYSNHA